MQEELKDRDDKITELLNYIKDEEEEVNRLNQLYQDEHCDNLELRKALEEIREIVTECKNCCIEPPAMRFKCPDCKEKMREKIEQVTKEVLDER